MAVDAQQFPVAAVGRIIPVIMVFVMDRQLSQFFARKITAAFCTDPREDLQRLISIVYFFHSLFFRRGFPLSLSAVLQIKSEIIDVSNFLDKNKSILFSNN